jgi:hypothetical protein
MCNFFQPMGSKGLLPGLIIGKEMKIKYMQIK